MGSPCALNLYCASANQFALAVEQCLQHVQRLENRYSRFKSESLVSMINDAAGSEQRFQLDDECWQLLQYAHAAYRVSDGLFDITSGVLREVWDFKNKVVPPTADITQYLALVGWTKLQLNQQQFHLPVGGMQIDFGGIVKEYAADVLVATLKAHGINHGLVDLGGDIAVVGPHPDNSPWQVAISHPANPQIAIAKIPLMSGGLASSGDYQRFIEIDGQRYSHILSPTTGWPVQGLAGVSVWAPQCVIAGTLATTAMLKGEQQGVQWLEDQHCQYVAITQLFAVRQSPSKA